ncbi:MAG TPA: hypothetical protein VGE90_14525 [Chitinophaga sp.]
MATLEEGFEFTGSLGKFSAYRMKGSDKIIIRKKGGPSRQQVLKSKNFVRLRENMKEFPGVGKAVRAIRSPLRHVKHLAGYNFTSDLTIACKQIQLLDPAGDRGGRSIFLSQHRYMLAGFRLNKKQPFLGMVGGPVSCIFKRETKSALIQLPGLVKGINLHLPWKQPLYRFSMSLGVVPDIIYEKDGYNDHADEWTDTHLDTEWHIADEPFQSRTLELKLDNRSSLKDTQTLIFAIGIEMGMPTPYGDIEEVQYAGSACILTAG